jgi:hypothetical protein
LAKFILQEYDFDIVHKIGRVNQDVDGLSRSPSSSEEDTTSVRWHGKVDLEIVLGGMLLHTYVCCWGVLGMYPKATWVVGIPIMTMMN